MLDTVFRGVCDENDKFAQVQTVLKSDPNARVEVFAIPGRFSDDLRARYASLDRVDVGCFGYWGATAECGVWGYEETLEKLIELEELGFARKFMAPGFAANEHVYDALLDRGWSVVDSAPARHLWGKANVKRAIVENGPEYGRDVGWHCVVSSCQNAANSVVEDWMRIADVPVYDRPQNGPVVWSSWIAAREHMPRDGDVLILHHISNSGLAYETVKEILEFDLRVVVPNESTAADLKRLYGVEADAVIGYWLADEEKLPPTDEFRVGILGRDAWHKRFELVRDVCSKESWPLVDYTQEDDPLWERSLDDFWRQVTVVVSPSEFEGGPLPPLEALARGRWAVATPVGMMPAVDGVLKATPETLADRLREVERRWREGEEPPGLDAWVSDEARVAEAWKGVLT